MGRNSMGYSVPTHTDSLGKSKTPPDVCRFFPISSCPLELAPPLRPPPSPAAWPGRHLLLRSTVRAAPRLGSLDPCPPPRSSAAWHQVGVALERNLPRTPPDSFVFSTGRRQWQERQDGIGWKQEQKIL